VGAAIMNVALNLFLIPVIGIYGAIISTCISDLMIAVLRIIGSRKYVAFKIQYSYLVCNSIILLVQAINESLSSNNNMRVVVDIIVLGLILLINRIRIKDLLEMAVITLR
jgi:O-antigen/teichoic acid export membrane protein